jgi:hypothetical protein
MFSLMIALLQVFFPFYPLLQFLLKKRLTFYIVNMNGNGLVGNYFSDDNLGTQVATEVDATIDFNWGTGMKVITPFLPLLFLYFVSLNIRSTKRTGTTDRFLFN